MRHSRYLIIIVLVTTLVEGFDILSGSQAITIPASAPARSDYEIVCEYITCLSVMYTD